MLLSVCERFENKKRLFEKALVSGKRCRICDYEIAVYQSYCKRIIPCTTLWPCVKNVGLLTIIPV